MRTYLFLVLFFISSTIFANGPSFSLLIGQDTKSIDDYVEATKTVPDGIMVYTSLRYLEGIVKEPMDWGDARVQGNAYVQEQWLKRIKDR